MRLIIAFLVGFNLTVVSTSAQLKLPDDEQLASTAQSNYALLSDNLKADNYNAARKPLQWIVHNTPDLHKSVYIHGVNLYNALEDKASGKEKVVFQDSIITLYDLRAKYFGDEANITDRKAAAAYQFYKEKKGKYKFLLDVFDKDYELNGENMSLSNIATYMDVVKKYDENTPLTTDEILERYYHVMEALEEHDEEGTDKIAGAATNLLIKAIGEDFDCDFIARELAPQLKNDISVAKRIITLSLSQGCTKEDYFTDAAKVLIEEDPDPGLIRVVASKEVEDGNYEIAMKYYKKAIEVSDDDAKTAKIMIDIARLYQVQNDYPQAREYATKALAIDSDLKKAYKLIGDLYFNSFEMCRQNKNIVSDRAVFWIAYDMYEKAGEQELMKNARAQFPSIGEIFERDYKESDSYTVGCWINKSTIIRRRPE